MLHIHMHTSCTKNYQCKWPKQTCIETKQNRREVCSNDARNKQRREAHQELKEQSTRVNDEATDTLPVCYQWHEYSTHCCGATKQWDGPNGEVSWDSGCECPVDSVRNIAVDDELLHDSSDAEQQKRRLSQQREVQRALNVAFQLIT